MKIFLNKIALGRKYASTAAAAVVVVLLPLSGVSYAHFIISE